MLGPYCPGNSGKTKLRMCSIQVQFFLQVFNPRLVKSIDRKSVGMEGQGCTCFMRSSSGMFYRPFLDCSGFISRGLEGLKVNPLTKSLGTARGHPTAPGAQTGLASRHTLGGTAMTPAMCASLTQRRRVFTTKRSLVKHPPLLRKAASV